MHNKGSAGQARPVLTSWGGFEAKDIFALNS